MLVVATVLVQRSMRGKTTTQTLTASSSSNVKFNNRAHSASFIPYSKFHVDGELKSYQQFISVTVFLVYINGEFVISFASLVRQLAYKSVLSN